MKQTLLALAGAGLIAWSACSTEQAGPQGDTSEVPSGPTSAAFGNRRTTDRFATTRGELVVSPLEHASVLFGWDGRAIYVDPTTTAVEDKHLPKADVVFVTEDRLDHLDPVAIERLRQAGTVVVGPAAAASRTPLDVVMRNGDARLVAGIQVTAVPMYSLARGPGPGLLYHDKGRGNGYVLGFGGVRVYLSGDTECTPEMEALDRIGVAFISVHEPQTMTEAEAIRCVEAFRPRVVFPYHDRRVDLTSLSRALSADGIDVRVRELSPRPERWRRDAVTACAEGQWGICRDRLELARLLDPAGESDPRVVAAREQVRAWQSPFPPWW